tara:strand:+ start:747 stop:1100 length:354 start_codon:yes stop_codon:yes gene_type:complete
MTVYVFDIDGTICSKVDDGDYSKAKPIKNRIERINALYDQGNKIVFQTARGMGRSGNSQAYAWKAFGSMTHDQLQEWGVKYHSLFLGKPAGDVYIDDKGIADGEFFDLHRKIEKAGE